MRPVYTLLRPSVRRSFINRRKYHASVLPSLVSPLSPDFQDKAKGMDELVDDLKVKLAAFRQGGSAKARTKMKESGKLLPRERYFHLVWF